MGDPQIIQSDWWSLAEAFGVPKLSKTSFCGFSKSDFLVVLQHKGDIARRKTMIFWSLGFVQWWVAPVGGTWCRWRDGPFGGGWTLCLFPFSLPNPACLRKGDHLGSDLFGRSVLRPTYSSYSWRCGAVLELRECVRHVEAGHIFLGTNNRDLWRYHWDPRWYHHFDTLDIIYLGTCFRNDGFSLSMWVFWSLRVDNLQPVLDPVLNCLTP